jgi:hypothetical protein
VGHGINGLRLPSIDGPAIGNAIRTLAGDAGLTRSLANADDDLDRFSLSEIGKQWLRLAE